MFVVKLLSAALLVHAALSHPMDDMIRDARAEGNTFNGIEWCILAAGSRGYHNYRHQSDIFHAYHVCHEHGIPASRIITIAYDDVANHPSNPYKNNIINKPGGKNVYSNIKIDYKGNDATAKTLLNVIQGNSAAVRGHGTGRVLTSGANDHVFIFLDDHGAPGLVAMPVGGVLSATAFMNALTNMHRQRKYEKMVVYIEACESGSMFYRKLPSNMKIYGTTASNEKESSYACYYDNARKAFLGDVYSVKWMEDTEASNVKTKTLQQQFQIVRKQTHNSHVKEYGEIGVSFSHLSDFEGPNNLHNEQTVNEATNEAPVAANNMDVVDSRDVPIMLEFYNLKDAKNQGEKEEIFVKLHQLLEKRIHLIKTMKKIFDHSSQAANAQVSWEDKHYLTNDDCYFPIVEKFHGKCFDLNDNEYAMTYLHKFVTLCENGVSHEIVHSAIDLHCQGENVIGTI